MKPPILVLDKVWHVGDMTPTSKRDGSYEGSGLSISLTPYAWRLIARGLVVGDTWKLTRHGARFLDVVNLNEGHKADITKWGEAEGLIILSPIWTWTYWDDETECEIQQNILSLDEARFEADDNDGDIVQTSSFISLPKLDALACQHRPTLGIRCVIDLIAPLYAEKMLGFEGTWWEERLDPLSLSAPRGVIPKSQVALWTASRSKYDPDENHY